MSLAQVTDVVAVVVVLGRFHHVHSLFVSALVVVVVLVQQPSVLAEPENDVAVACTEVGTAVAVAAGTAAGIAAVAVGTAVVAVVVVPHVLLPLGLAVVVLGVDFGIAAVPIVGLVVRHCY